MHCQTTNQRDRGDPVLKYFIVDSDEQRPDILCLGEMLVKPFVEGGKHGVPYTGVWKLINTWTTTQVVEPVPGSAIATVNSLSITSLMISIEWLLAW